MELNEEELENCMKDSKKKGWRNEKVNIQFWTSKLWFSDDKRNEEVKRLYEEGPALYTYLIKEVLTNAQIKKIDDWLKIREIKEIFERWG